MHSVARELIKHKQRSFSFPVLTFFSSSLTSLSCLMMFTDETGPAWVDTRGWEDRAVDNTNTFQVPGLSSPVLSCPLLS